MKPAVTSFSYFTSHKMSLVRPGSHPTGKVIQVVRGQQRRYILKLQNNLVFEKNSTKLCHISFTRFSSIKQLFYIHQVDSSKAAFCRKKILVRHFILNRSFTEEIGRGWALWLVDCFPEKDSNFSQTTELWATLEFMGNGKQIVESR